MNDELIGSEDTPVSDFTPVIASDAPASQKNGTVGLANWTNLNHCTELQTFFDISPDLLVILAPDRTVRKANQAWQSVLGYSEAELKSIRLADLLHPDDRQKTLDYTLTILKTHQSEPYVNRYRSKSGDYRFIEWHVQEDQQWFFCAGRDITIQKQAEKHWYQKQELLIATLNSVGEGIIATDIDGRITLMNPLAEQYTGWTLDEAIGQDFSLVFRNIDLQTRQPGSNPIQIALETGQISRSPRQVGLVSRSGAEWYISGNASVILSPNGERTGVVVAFRDVTKEYTLEHEIDGFLKVNMDMLCVSDTDGNFVKVNQKFQEILGFRTDELEGQNYLHYVHKDDLQLTVDATRDLGKQKAVTGFVNRFRCKDGSYKYIEWQAQPGFGNLVYSSARDVTAQKNYEEQLKILATKDELTGLYNRHYFEMIIVELMDRSDRYHESLSMLLLDLDHFKQVNDTWGHPIGDELLKHTARIISQSIRDADILFRIGGEEFVVLMPNTAAGGAAVAAEKIRSEIEAHTLAVTGPRTASLGVAERMRSESYRHWYRRVDDALYQAKQNGRNQVFLSDEEVSLPYSGIRLDWRQEWECGNLQIDQQHQELIRIANQLINLSFSGADNQTLLRQLDLLLDHIAHHFDTEEIVLRDVGYPDLRNHINIHQNLLAKAVRLKASYLHGELKTSAFFSFVVDDVFWGHLIKQDVKFFPWIQAEQ